MDKLSVIINGYKNYLFPTKKARDLALTRANVCANCDFATSSFFTLPDNTATEGLKCSKCTCPNLSIVVMANDKKCPIGKW
jgi:hypothetical protein